MKKLNKKRRIESKTNYAKRLKLLKSNSPRLVVRKTNKYIILQIVESENAQDKIVSSVNTKELLNHGWPADKSGSLKSLSAGYLGGFLIAKKTLENFEKLNSKFSKKKFDRIILDSGLIPNTKGSRIYAVVKGAVDGGLNIPYDNKIIPDEKMINKYDFLDKIKKNIK